MLKSVLAVWLGGCLTLGGALLGTDAQIRTELKDVSAATMARVGQIVKVDQAADADVGLGVEVKVGAGEDNPCAGASADMEADASVEADADAKVDVPVGADPAPVKKEAGLLHLIVEIITKIGLGPKDDGETGAVLDAGVDIEAGVEAGEELSADIDADVDLHLDEVVGAKVDVDAEADAGLELGGAEGVKTLLEIDLGESRDIPGEGPGLLDCLCP
jgi:hypothetical protein